MKTTLRSLPMDPPEEKYIPGEPEYDSDFAEEDQEEQAAGELATKVCARGDEHERCSGQLSSSVLR